MNTPESKVLIAGQQLSQQPDLLHSLRRQGFLVEAIDSPDTALDHENLSDYSAVILDGSYRQLIENGFLEKMNNRAPSALLMVAFDQNDRDVLDSVTEIGAMEVIANPINETELRIRLIRHNQRQRIMDELHDSIHFINLIANATPDLMYLFDAEQECSVYVNQRVAEAFDCSPNGICPAGYMYFASVIHPDDRDRVRATLNRRFRNAEDGEVVEAEYRVKVKGGDYRWLRCRETVFSRCDGNAEQILGTAMDITNDRLLDETRELLASIVSHSDDAIIGKSLNGQIVTWNAAAARIYGYSTNEALGQHISMIIPDALQDGLTDILDRIRRGFTLDHFETIRIDKEGRTFPVSVTISPIRDAEGQVIGASTIARKLDGNYKPTVPDVGKLGAT